jgi:isoleucyl-tRNA synthetase
MYAESCGWDKENYVVSNNILDKWILIRLHQVTGDISKNLEAYNIPPVVRSVEEFVDDLSRWYVRRSRDRISSGDNEALSTLYKVLMEFSKAAAPVIPFISESIFKSLNGDEENISVHLCDYPSYDEMTDVDNSILENMKKVRDISSQVLSIRVEKGVPVRQALGNVAILKENSVPEEYFPLILEETNVKNILEVNSLDEKDSWELDSSNLVRLDMEITEELLKEGRLREFIRSVQGLRKEAGLSVSDKILLTYKNDPETSEVVEMFKNEIETKLVVEKIIPGDETKVEKV